MKKGLVLLVAIVAVVVIGSVAVASAQNGLTSNWQPMSAGMIDYTGNYTGTLPFHGGRFGGMMGTSGITGQIEAAVAQKLGMTASELTSALQGGQTIDQIAQSKSVSIDDLNKVALDAAKSALADQVKQGTITQQQADALLNRMTTPLLNFGRGFGRGKMGGYQGVPGGMMADGGVHQQIWTAIAQKLGMTSADLTKALQSGQTLAQLAQSKGVSLDDLKKAVNDAVKAELDALVQKGTITQQQEDQMLSKMQNMPFQGFGFGFGQRGGRGFGFGRGNQPNNGNGNQGGTMPNLPQISGQQG